MYSEDYEIIHAYREKNHVAGRLTNIAHTHHGRWEFFRVQDLPPRGIRRFYYADSLGIYNFRK